MRRLRLEWAARALAQTDQPLVEIALPAALQIRATLRARFDVT
jgi:transcriptional regulator GlxA family with amidase domain